MDKYKATTTELFKIKMQLRAQINHLRRTYNQIVVEKHTPQKKHFNNHFQRSSIIQPLQQKSLKKNNTQKKHFSPNIVHISQTSKSPGKKQFSYKNQHQNINKYNCSKRKSSSYLLNVGRSLSTINLKKQSTGYIIGRQEFQKKMIDKPSKKIFTKKHQFNKELI